MCPVSYSEYVKKPGEEVEWTTDLIQELKKCRDDIIHFLSYIKIPHPEKGLTPFIPFDFQKDIIELYQNHRYLCLLCPRQVGKTQIIGACALHFALFNEYKTIGIASNKAESAKDVLARIKFMYEQLPSFLKPGVVEWNKSSVEFENGTKIISVAASPDAFRGRTLSTIILDEFAHLKSLKLQSEFFDSNYPTIAASQSAKMIIISTPKGIGDLFYEIYTTAERKLNQFIAYKAPWNCRPERTEEWKKAQIENMGITRWNQEMECIFVGSTATIVNTETLEYLLKNTKYPISLQYNQKVRIYEEKIPNALYIAGTDVAKGSGEHDAVLHIARVVSLKPVKLVHVAVFQDNFTDTYKFADIIYRLCSYYNDAFVAIESNSEGDGVIKRLFYDFEYENLVNEGGTIDKLGVRATKKTKPRAVLLMKKLLEEKAFELFDEKTIKQLASFVDDNGKLRGNDGAPDDLVSGLYWLCYVLTFDLFDDSAEIPMAKENEEEAWGIVGDSDPDDIENFWNEG